LEALVGLYLAGQRAPLPLFPESSLVFAQASPDGRPMGPRERQSVLRRWGWDAERVPDLVRLVGQGCPLFPEEFQAVGALALPAERLPEAARAIWGPLLAARVGGR
jgi:exonuclease V gamma subunit